MIDALKKRWAMLSAVATRPWPNGYMRTTRQDEYKWKSTERRSLWIDNTSLNVINQDPDQAALKRVLKILRFLYSSKPYEIAGRVRKPWIPSTPYNLRRPPQTQAMDTAAKLGNLPLVQWLHSNQREGCSIGAISEAAALNHQDVVKWLHENRSEGYTAKTFENAIRNGHLDMVQWLHSKKRVACPRAMDIAAGRGHIQMLKWLHSNRSDDCTRRAIAAAARGGHFEIVKWLRKNRSEGWSSHAIDCAAAIGRLDIIKFLHGYDNKGSSHRAFENAAKQGHISVMKWLVDHALVDPLHAMAVSENAVAYIENFYRV